MEIMDRKKGPVRRSLFFCLIMNYEKGAGLRAQSAGRRAKTQDTMQHFIL